MIAGERAALRSWSAGLRAASSEGQVISQSVSQGYNASLVLRCGEELDEAAASLKQIAESSSVPVIIRRECFVAGTLIHTREGEKAIEEIREGDEVLSYNTQTQQTEYKPVVQTFTHEAKELLNVRIEGESEALGVTATHPFYVRRARDCTSDGDGDDPPSEASRGEWVAAKELKAGDLVRRPNGEWVRVEKVEKRSKGERVYNFEVADNHNYFVGRQGTLVHNTCPISEALDPNDPYILFNETHGKSRPNPKDVGPGGGPLQSHHGLQKEWAIHNLSRFGYNGDLAPSITLENGVGFPHSFLSREQRIRYNRRKAAGLGLWSSTLQEELGYIVSDLRGAGFSNKTIKKVLEQQYSMLDKLNVPYKRIRIR